MVSAVGCSASVVAAENLSRTTASLQAGHVPAADHVRLSETTRRVPTQAGVTVPHTSPPVELKPGVQLPPDLPIMRSMNNVDLIKHGGRYYMAFRTGATHFASTKVLMHVLSSADGFKWDLEKTIHMGSDMREPRFLSFNGKLFFYYFRGGTHPLKFEPDRMFMLERTDKGWSEPESFFEPGYVPWRAKVFDGKAYLSVYYGRGLYGDQSKNAIHLLESTDGRNWKRISEKPQVAMPGAEEPEFEFDREGNIWGTVRLENKGAMVFFAPKEHLDRWQFVPTKDKYDSALVFRHGDEFYLITRRNLDGVMDKAPAWMPEKLGHLYNLARYSLTRKRTAFYYLDRQQMKAKWLYDLPSHGDTTFPALAPLNGHQYLLVNYSSKLEKGHDYAWIRGQLSDTRLYSHVVTFPYPHD